MLTSALAIYDSTADKVTFYDFVKDNMPAFLPRQDFWTKHHCYDPRILRKARKAEAAAKLAANDTQKLNDKLEIALKKRRMPVLQRPVFLTICHMTSVLL